MSTSNVFVTSKCGGLGKYLEGAEEPLNMWTSTIVLWDCRLQSKRYILYYLCKMDKPVNTTSKVKSAVLSASAVHFSSHFISCPSNHTTYLFLACDVHSACWGRDVVQFGADGSNWDIPSASSCPVPGLTLPPPSFECATGSVRVPYTFVCDHRQDCSDDSDESFCLFLSCQEHGLQQCGNVKQCYASRQHCDGQTDCVNEVDEGMCPEINDVGLDHPRPSIPPFVVDFAKNGRTAITSVHTVGDGQWPSFQVCPDTHYQCSQNGYCLPTFTRCNGLYDCPDHEDETNCHSYYCPGHYRCFDSQVCVHPNQVCDGINHCPRLEDELLCDQHCPEQCICHGLALTCPRSFPAHSYPELRYLNARGSGMAMFDLSANNMLVYLSLADCQLKTVSNITLSNVITLDLSRNRLDSIPMKLLLSSPYLKTVFLSDNPITDFIEMDTMTKMKNIPQITFLDLSLTFLHTVDHSIISLFPGIKSLNLSHSGTNYVTGLGFQPLRKLEIVDLRGCPMSIIDKNLMVGLNHLHTVYADEYKVCCAAMLLPDFNNCQAPQDELSSCKDLLKSILYRICLAVFSSLALMGNGISFVFRLSSLQGSGSPGFSAFVLHLCVSDFLMGIYLMLVGIADGLHRSNYIWEDVAWRHSFPCKLAGVLSLMSCEVSSFLICLVTLDRFLVVRFPLSFLRFKGWNAQLASCLSWVTGFVLAAVPLMPGVVHWEFYSQTGICIPLPVTTKMFAGQSYSFGIMIVLNFILFCIVALGQAIIYWSVRSNTLKEGISNQRSQDASIARRLFTVVISDFLCWFPICLLGLLVSQGVSVSGELNVLMAVIVMPLNSALNPFLYTLNLVFEKQQKQKEERLFKLMKAQNC